MATSDEQLSKIEYADSGYPVAVDFIDLQSSDNTYTGWAWHEDIKVVIINHGTAQINSDDQSIRLLPGQAVIIGRNVMHSIVQFGDEGCAYYVITFHPDFVLGKEGDRTHEEYLNVIDNNYLKFMIIDESISWHAELLELLNSTIAANIIQATGYELMTKSYLCMFWAIMADHIDESDELNEDMPISLDAKRVKDAMSFIREHYAEKLTLEEIAGHVHISTSECCRCFKRSIAMTPFEYLVKYRVFEAASLLRDPAHSLDSIADIATSVGFNNFSYFSKQFGKYMNCTPRQYRSDSKAYNKPNTDFMSFL